MRVPMYTIDEPFTLALASASASTLPLTLTFLFFFGAASFLLWWSRRFEHSSLLTRGYNHHLKVFSQSLVICELTQLVIQQCTAAKEHIMELELPT